MIPSEVPVELQNLSQCEEMLICRAFPLMQIYYKSSGNLSYKGHIITLPHNVQKIADILPNKPNDLPLLSFTVKGKGENKKSFKVRREKVLNALKWLIANNPSYKDVVLDELRINSLPEGGKIESKNIFIEEVGEEIPDKGPSNDEHF